MASTQKKTANTKKQTTGKKPNGTRKKPPAYVPDVMARGIGAAVCLLSLIHISCPRPLRQRKGHDPCTR